MSRYKPTAESKWVDWALWREPSRLELDDWVASGDPCLRWVLEPGATPVEIYAFECGYSGGLEALVNGWVWESPAPEVPVSECEELEAASPFEGG